MIDAWRARAAQKENTLDTTGFNTAILTKDFPNEWDSALTWIHKILNCFRGISMAREDEQDKTAETLSRTKNL